jgi:hypothetical protein
MGYQSNQAGSIYTERLKALRIHTLRIISLTDIYGFNVDVHTQDTPLILTLCITE